MMEDAHSVAGFGGQLCSVVDPGDIMGRERERHHGERERDRERDRDIDRDRER